MEPARPKRGSKGSVSSRSEKSSSRPSSRGSSHKSGRSKSKSKTNSPVQGDQAFDDGVEDHGAYKLDYTDSEEIDYDAPTDLPDSKMAMGEVEAQEEEEEHLEPYIDEDAVQSELGAPISSKEKVDEEIKEEPNDSKDCKTTEDDEESEATTAKKKKGKRLKKVTEKRIGFDGREVVFVTECTQTDWKWKDNSEKAGKFCMLPTSEIAENASDDLTFEDDHEKELEELERLRDKDELDEKEGIEENGVQIVKPDSRATLSAKTEDESLYNRTGTDLTPFSLEPNDEFGIPMLEMSSDSDSSDDEGKRKTKVHKHHIPTIGPPKILKYIRESDRMDRDSDRTNSSMDDEFRPIDSADYVLDQDGNVAGMFSGPCEFCGNDIKPFPSLEQQLAQPPETLYCCEDYREFVEFTMNTASKLEEEAAKRKEKISIKVHGHHGSKQARKMAKEQAVQRMRERELQRRQQEATGLQAAYYNFARQMKTINYQLSSQKCLEEGWTLRAPSPLDLDDTDCEVFIPEPLHPAMIASGKLHNRKLIQKFYPDESKFLTMFPDGTGNVFYPSGRLAILITCVSLGQFTYIVQDDSESAEILAVFEPTGYGCSYFPNGKVRLTYDQYGGMELDYTGGRKRSWSWRDQETHVHAPPFQPIVFGVNRYIGVRLMAQQTIALTLTGRKRSCRFNVGSKLKLVSPENIIPKPIDENQLFIDERKVKVDHILNKVTNLLKFPKSPKVDRILPPLSVSSRMQKVDRMKADYAANLAVPPPIPTRRQRKIGKPNSRLSPIPNVAVNVN